ncbi:MAG TPA: hypothetical protein VGV37_17770 [Aliidongia sp.]|uniref:hypothetical protein n=1 Tax=Aliidongia sp. TaxID=1914230 RepID=UPI002DDD0434|nr:hypothetical protein [Aliidongia sp.]HEV2676379.1 hypothetical protein [Aliidongia sp.]
MKQILSAAVVGLAIIGAGTAVAQTPPATGSTKPPAITHGTADSHSTAAPVAGKNSFTEAQARDRLEKHGYSAVSALKKDDQSVWRGTATKDGKSVGVAVDYQGNIVGQ